MCIHGLVCTCLFSTLSLENASSNKPHSALRSWYLNTILQKKEPGLTGKMFDSRAGAEERHIESGASDSSRMPESREGKKRGGNGGGGERERQRKRERKGEHFKRIEEPR